MSAEASPILQLCVALFRNMKGRGSVHYRCTFLKVLHFALEIAQQGSHFLFAVYILPFSKCCIFALENYLSLWLIFSSSTTTDERGELWATTTTNYGTFVLTYFRSLAKWNFCSLELSLSRTFIPGSNSVPGAKVTWNCRSQELSFYGTFVPARPT